MPMTGIMVAMTDEVVDSIPGLVPGNMVALQYALGLARQSGVSEPEDSRADSLSAQPNVHIDALATIDSSAGLRSAASADTTSFLTSPVVVVSPRDSGAAIDADGDHLKPRSTRSVNTPAVGPTGPALHCQCHYLTFR